MVLGIIGGILGIVIAIFAIGAGSVVDMATRAVTGNGELPEEFEEVAQAVGRIAIGTGIGGLIFSIVGLVGATMVNKNSKIAGILMLVAGILGFIFFLGGFIVPGILLLVGGALAIAAKDEAQA